MKDEKALINARAEKFSGLYIKGSPVEFLLVKKGCFSYHSWKKA